MAICCQYKLVSLPPLAMTSIPPNTRAETGLDPRISPYITPKSKLTLHWSEKCCLKPPQGKYREPCENTLGSETGATYRLLVYVGIYGSGPPQIGVLVVCG